MSDSPIKDAIEALYKPIESIVKTLAGPAAEEIGQSFRDSMQVWRFKRQARLFQRVKEICDDAGIKPQAVKLPLLFNVVEQASLEEDDELQDRWANLLANASDPAGDAEGMTAFPDILRQLSKTEANLLNDFYEVNAGSNDIGMPAVDISPIYYDNLTRFRLIVPEDDRRMPTSAMLDARAMAITIGQRPMELCFLSALGSAFVKACRAPKKRS
jgi:hypothetical protein